MPSASRSSVAQLSVSASQLKKLIKAVSSLVLKKQAGNGQVGAMSKAQKYSWNNSWKHLGNFFPKKVFGKKVA